MKTKLTLLSIVLFLTVTLHAQVFTQGDVSLTAFHHTLHDTTVCGTYDSMYMTVTIQNSFIGDSFRIMDAPMSWAFYTGHNTTGQSPWVSTFLLFDPTYAMGDRSAFYNSGILYTFFHDLKAISGSDTIASISYDWQTLIPNPCEYSTVTGKVFYDNNGNCIFDSGIDIPLQGLQVHAFSLPNWPNSGNEVTGGLTDGSGNYSLNVLKSWLQQLQLNIDFNPLVFPPSSCYAPQLFFYSLPTNIDFPLDCSSNFDLRCAALSPGSARPLLPFMLHPTVSNTGCPPVSGILHLVLDNRVAYNAGLSTLPADSISGDTLMWYYNNLTNLTNGAYWNSFVSHIHLTPDNTLNIGDSLCFTVFTNVPTGDIDLANNFQSFCIPIVNSYDPNLKEVSPKGEGAQGIIPASTAELTYTVHFQNTGNADAFNIYVADTLDPNIIPGSAQILEADHTMTVNWVDSTILNFVFNNINLPDSNSNEPESHGTFRFKVKLKPNLAPGTQIKNQAAIYFDNNSAIYTNTVLNTIETPQGFVEAGNVLEMKLFPNPATDQLFVQVDKALVGARLNVYDVTGALVSTMLLNTANCQLPTAAFPAGVYIAEVKTGEVAVKQRWVKM